jgi:hypothetical protein
MATLWLTVVVISLLGIFEHTTATHFAFGTVSWKKAPDASPYEYNVDVEVALRYSYFVSNGNTPTVGEELQIFCQLRYLPENCDCPGCEFTDGTEYWLNRRGKPVYDEGPPDNCDYPSDASIDLTYFQEISIVTNQVYEGDYFVGNSQILVTIPDITIGDWVAREKRWHVYFYGFSRLYDFVDGNND